MLTQMGIEPQRVKLVWASAAEGARLAQEITTMVEEVRALGPLNWGQDEVPAFNPHPSSLKKEEVPA